MNTTNPGKIEYLTQLREFATAFDALVAQGEDLANVWAIRAYQAGGAAAVTDAEASDIGCTATQLQLGINLMGQLVNLKKGDAVAASSQYQTFVENARRLT